MTVKAWTIRVLALALVAGTVAVAHDAERKVDVRSVAFDAHLGSAAGWTCTKADKPELDAGGAVIKQSRLYRNAKSQQIAANLVATATRLGGLRDYSVALEAQGWVRGNHEVVSGPEIASLGRPMLFRLERLHQGGKRQLALAWFVSSRRQAHDLAGAEFGGWTDLILASRPPLWIELYATTDAAQDEASTRTALVDFAQALGPMLAKLAQQESGRLGANA